MKTISPDSFAMICFLVLIQNNHGLEEKSPDYITEKTSMLRAGYDAFAYLDIHNMRKACQWCHDWHIDIPTDVALEMQCQNEAAENLAAKGFNL
jgi:hypothetical protein